MAVEARPPLLTTTFIQMSPKQLGAFKMTADEMIEKLLRDGYVDQVSAKLRYRLHQALHKRGIAVRSKVLGTVSSTSACRWSTHKRAGPWSMKLLAQRIHHFRISGEAVEEYCHKQPYIGPKPVWDFNLVRRAFEVGVSVEERAQVLEKGWGEALRSYKWTPFDCVRLLTNVVRISLVT